MPATPVRQGRHVHFSPATPALNDGSGSQSLGHYSQTDPQAAADDPFIGSRGSVIADTYAEVFFSFFSIILFLNLITGEL